MYVHISMSDSPSENVDMMSQSTVRETDPVLESFLDFLAKDLAEHPELLLPLRADFVERVQALVAGVEVDLDAKLLEEGE